MNIGIANPRMEDVPGIPGQEGHGVHFNIAFKTSYRKISLSLEGVRLGFPNRFEILLASRQTCRRIYQIPKRKMGQWRLEK